jgi:hypothetical protein
MMMQPNQSLDQMLESGIVVSWNDLMPVGTSGKVHVKYRFAVDHSLANLQVWTSEIRGHWLLVCEYAGVPSTNKEIHLTFSNNYHSDLLTQFLQFVVEHQHEFARAPELNRDSLVQVQVPTEAEKAQALKLISEARTRDELHEPTELTAAS